MEKRGSGTLTLTGANTHTGLTTVSAGTLQLGNDPNVSFGSIGRLRSAITVDPGATLLLNGNNVLGFGAGTRVTGVNLNGGVLTHAGSDGNGWGVAYQLTGATMQSTGAGSFSFGGPGFGNSGDNTSVQVNPSSLPSQILGRITLREGNQDFIVDANFVNFTIADGTAPHDLLIGADIGEVQGSHGIVKLGAGRMTMTGTNTYTGGTTIGAGALRIGDNAPSGTLIGNVLNNAALEFHRPDAASFAGDIQGTGTVVVWGTKGVFTNVLTFSGNNSYGGATTIRNNATLAISSASNLGPTTQVVGLLGALRLVGEVTLPNTLNGVSDGLAIDTNGTTDTISGAIIGSGRFRKQGAGTLIFTGQKTAGSVPILINEGTLQIGNGGTAGNIVDSVSNGGALAFNRSDAVAYDGVISDSLGDTGWNFAAHVGAVQQLGPGTLVLSQNHTYTGGTTIAAGTLQLGAGGTSGSVVGDIVDNGALVFDRSGSMSHAGAISGSGTLTKAGSGTLNLGGAGTYAGLTTVNAGRLNVNGSIDSSVQVDAGATLGGLGTAAALATASVTIGDGAHLSPGTSPGTLTIGGALVLGADAQLDYELGLPNVIGGTQNDLTVIGGDLTLDGALNLFNIGGMSPGVYRLFDYGGTLTDNGLAIGASLPTRFVPSDFLVDVSTAGEVNLLAQSGGFALQFWDGANTTPNNAVDGGTATWTNAPSNWTGVDGVLNTSWQGGFAVFQGTPGAVTLGENIALQGMQFRTGGYSIEAGGFALAGEPETIVNVDTRVTAAINAPLIDGAGGATRLVKNGSGLMVLGGANSYSGGTAIDSGAVQVARDDNLGAAGGALALNAGLLITTGSFTSARPVTIGVDGGSFSTEGATILTLAGPVDGGGQLGKVGAGTLVMTGNNSYAGGTFLGNGVLQVGSDGNLGAANGILQFGGGTLRLGASFDPDPARPVELGELGGTLDTQGFSTTFAQAIGGTGALTKAGVGTLVLTASNGYTGGTTIAAGSLQLGDGGATGSVVGDIANQGVLTVNRSDVFTLDGLVSGSGSLIQSGSGTLVLDDDHTYTGGTTIAAGALQLGAGDSTGSVVGDIVDNGALVFDRADALTFAGIISGSGTMTKRGDDTLTLTGNNTYTGTTTIESGVLQIGNGGTSGTIAGPVANQGALVFNRSDNLAVAGVISGSGLLRQSGPGVVTLTGTNSYSGGTFIDAGVLGVRADQNLGDMAGTVTFNGGTLQLSAAFDSTRSLLLDSNGGTIDVATRNKLGGPIAGNGRLTKTGSGALILNSDASHTGATRVAAGTLVVGDSQHLQARLSGGGGVSVDAGASFGGYGSVVGAVDNRGTLGVGNALAALATEPDAEFTIVGPLINSGTITMVNGAAADRLNVNGSYVINGGRLELEAVLNEGGAATQADRLVADAVALGGAATGIVVHALDGSGAFTLGDGIVLVDVANAAASAPGAFALAQRVVAGPHEYLLFQGGVADPGDGDWYLRNVAPVVEPPVEPIVEPPVAPIFRPEVGAYLGNRQATTASLVHTLHERLGEPQYAQAAGDQGGFLGSVWLRVRDSNTQVGAGADAIDIEGGRSLFQFGGDLAQWGLFGDSDRLHLGGMLGYARSESHAAADFNPARARGESNGNLAGLYATWFANDEQRLGSYLDAWTQYGRFDNKVRSEGLPDVTYDSDSWALSLEYGYAMAAGEALVIEPQAQVIYSDYSSDDIVEENGTRVRSLDDSQTLTRLGLRLYQPRDLQPGLQPFVEVNWWHGDSSALAFNAVSVADDVPDNRYQLNVGLQGILAGGWTLWMQLGGAWGSDGYEVVEGQLGTKYSW